MLPYLIVFFLSTLFFYLSSKNEGKWQYVFLFLAILFPSLLAGLRDLTVGRDINAYAITTWNHVVESDDLSDLLIINVLDNIEIAYILINYLISRLTDDIQWFLFVYQLIIMIVIAKVFLKIKECDNGYFFILFYFLYYYCECLNLMRQSIAIALGVLAFIYLLEKRIVAYYIVAIIASLCHTSGFILFVMHPLMIFINLYGDNRWLSTLIVCSVVIFLLLLFKPVVGYLVNHGMIMEKFGNYIVQDDMNAHKIDLLFLVTLFFFMLIAVNDNSEIALVLFYFLLISIILTLFGEITEIAFRMAYYFVGPILMIIPLLRNNSIEHELLFLLTFVMIFVYFFYQAIATNIADTIPYHSSLLGI